jgi:DNA polymerase-3 subunit alpha
MFVHLHNHTEASIADGLFHPSKWVEALKDKGFKAHALTDHGVMTSALPFYKLMREEKMIPILGCEFYYVDDPLDKTKENRKAQHLIILAKDYDGFRNLLQLQNLAFTKGFYFRPRIGLEWLRKYSEGLICTSACQGGVLSHEVWREEDKEDKRKHHGLENKFDMFSDIFGEDFYVEFQGHGQEGQAKVNTEFYERLRGREGFNHVITNDCHYILPEHAKIQEMLKGIAYRTKNTEAGQSYTSCDSLWLKTPKQVYEAFTKGHDYLPRNFVVDGMKNTQEILEKCEGFRMPEDKRYLPTFRKGRDSKELFKKLTMSLFKKFIKEGELKASPAEYKERFIKEYKVICKYNLQDYFLIVWDLVRFAKSKGIFVGLGRGSAAGCLISYLMDIVKIDPLEYDLIFERFLNENRCEVGELPDIDLDFESERRGEIKDYIFKIYGRDKVCEIGTYGRMRLKTALIDFGKALGIVNNREILAVTTKLDLDKKEKDSLEAAVDSSPELKKLVLRDKEFFWPFAVEEIIGQIKSQAIHPAGLVVCSDKISTITPIKTQKSKELKDERVITTQAEDKYIIEQGLMKMDVLGLKEYDIVKSVLEGAGSEFTVDNYAKEIMKFEGKVHKKVWKFFQEGKTEGVFQFSSEGMQGLLREIEPDCVNDLIAANALYRPGCLENGWHLQYCRRKHGQEKVTYIHSIMEPSLKKTYGVIVYQEQFMEVFHKLGDISLSDSDTIRSALGKKDEDKLKKFKKQFVRGATKRIGGSQAEEIWRQIEKAAGYTFNKSHSAAYSVLAYISQYLKVRHPTHFWAAQVEWDTRKNKQDEMLRHKRAALDMGVEFAMPSINESKVNFTVPKKGKAVWSFRGIKGIGEKTGREIEIHQPYRDFDDFVKRVNKSKVKFNNMVNLVYAGVFDCFDDRKIILKRLFDFKCKKCPPTDEESLMMKFYEAMGFFEQKIKSFKPGFSMDIETQMDLEAKLPGEQATIGGMLTETRAIRTKKGDKMGFGTIVDLDETIEVTFFPEVWMKYRSDIKAGKVMQVTGAKSDYNGRQNLIEAHKVRLI